MRKTYLRLPAFSFSEIGHSGALDLDPEKSAGSADGKKLDLILTAFNPSKQTFTLC